MNEAAVPPDTHHKHDHHHHGETCSHAHDHAARAPEALMRAEEVCRTRGERLTPIRRRVLETLYSTHRPISAYDVIEAMAASGEKRMAAVTVYRTLDFLIAQGFVHRLESRNAFVACPATHAPDDVVVFMICERCGGVDEVHSDEMKEALSRLAQTNGFTPRSRIIELAGSCAHCHG